MNLKEIQDLIKFVAKSGACEVEIERKGFKLKIKTKNGSAAEPHTEVTSFIPVPQKATPEIISLPEVVKESPAPKEALIEVKSPMVGTFYRRPSPDKDFFINIGDHIKPGQVIGIIEAMKLFNEIESEVSGKIVKILVNDSTPVEYDQPLIVVDPAS